jgi:hypothetical protein
MRTGSLPQVSQSRYWANPVVGTNLTTASGAATTLAYGFVAERAGERTRLPSFETLAVPSLGNR